MGLGGAAAYDAVIYGDGLVAVGQFSGSGGEDCGTYGFPGPVPFSYVAQWSGTTWQPLGVEAVIQQRPSAATVTGSQLIVGGLYGLLASGSRVAAWNGTAWSDPDPGGLLDQDVAALASLDGQVYAGGNLGLVGSLPSSNPVAVWDGRSESTWSALESSAPGLAFNVADLATDSEHGLVYALGDWPDTASLPANTFNRIAVWDTTISEWVAMGPLTVGGAPSPPPAPQPIGLNQVTGTGGIAIHGADVFVGCANCDIYLTPSTFTESLAKWTWNAPSGSNNLAARTGETVTITGEGFVGVTTGGVTFGSTSVPFTRSGTSRITVTIPSSLASGSYAINVDAVGGTASVGTIAVTQVSGGGPAPSPTPTVIQPIASPSPEPSVAPSPSQLPGTSSMTIGGQEVQVQRESRPRGRGVTFSAGPVTMTMRSTAPNGQGVPLAPDGSLVLARSGEVPIEASGLAPGSTVTQTLYSNPVDLGSATVNSAGDVRAAPTIPASTPLGSHTLSIEGTTNTGDAFTFNIGVTVATPVVALGSDPVLDATLVRKHGTSLIDARARGVQARCLVAFTAGKQTARARGSTQGVASVTLPAASPRSGAVKVTMRVSGQGCVPRTESTIARQMTSR